MRQRFLHPVSLASLLVLQQSGQSFAFASSKPFLSTAIAASNSVNIQNNKNSHPTRSTRLFATATSDMVGSKITPAPPVHGIPGQDIKEEQPVRNPINEKSTVVVVGGSRGIGLEFVKQCAQKGAKVIATHRGVTVPEGLKQLVDDSSLKVETLSMDVTDEESIAKAAEVLKSRDNYTPLTHVIHNAGAYPTGMSLDGSPRGGRPAQPAVTKEDMMNAFLINSVGPLLVAQKFVPLLGRAPDSPEKNLPVYSVLSSKVGSVYDNTSGGTYAYRSSKSACNQVCRSLSVDLAGEASVVCLHPGYVRTDMTGGKGLIDTDESVSGMLRAIEATDATVGFRFVDYKACIIQW